MSEIQNDEFSRRDFLQLGVTVTAGVVLPSVLAACGGGGGEGSNPGPTETFKEPLNIQSVNKLLDVTIILSYLTIPFNGTIVTLRNMFGSIPAPTLRMSVGDTLRIKIINKLPPNPPVSATGTPVDIPPTWILSAPTTRNAAMLRLPAAPIPASPALTSPLGAIRSTSPG